MSVWFGPAGLPDDFPGKSSVQAPAWLASLGLDAFEYQCGKGVNVGEETARAVGTAAREHGIRLSLHAPYFINLANPDPDSRKKTTGYILAACRAADWMGAGRITVHTGALMKRARREALDTAIPSLREVLRACDGEGYGHLTLCPETMGKINQLGDLDEVLELCQQDERLLPCVDFGHLYAPNGGEKVHLTFDQKDFGPDPEPLMRALARRGWSPTIICESAGTQARDALHMKELYEGFLKSKGDHTI